MIGRLRELWDDLYWVVYLVVLVALLKLIDWLAGLW